MSTFDYIEKMKKNTAVRVPEALRQPSVKKDAAQAVSISYGQANSIGEEIARRFKTVFLPQISNLCTETESFFNMYSTSHDDHSGVAKQKKELKPVEDLYNALMKSQDVVLDFVAKRKKEITEAVEPAEIDSEEETGETSDVERLLTVIKQIADRDDLVQILEKIEDAAGLADELESALNTHESEIGQEASAKEY